MLEERKRSEGHFGKITDESMENLEAQLSIDTNSFVSSIISNKSSGQYTTELKDFIARKSVELSRICHENVGRFTSSIEEAKTLGETAGKLKETVEDVAQTTKRNISLYESSLSRSVELRHQIQELDLKIRAVDEFRVIVQRLKNINDEIENGYYLVAATKTLEFSNLETNLFQTSVLTKLKADVPSILAAIEAKAERKLNDWFLKIKTSYESIGYDFLEDRVPVLDNSSVYEFYLIEKLFGRASSFCDEFYARRRKQLDNLKDAKYPTLQQYLQVVAGFFYTEYRMGNDGFHIISQKQLEQLWTESEPKTMSVLEFKARGDLKEIFEASQTISNFCDKMESLSIVSPDSIRCYPSRWLSRIRIETVRDYKQKVRALIDADHQAHMTIHNSQEFATILKYRLAPPPPVYPADVNFAAFVPSCILLLDEQMEQNDAFCRMINENPTSDLCTLLFKALYQTILESMKIEDTFTIDLLKIASTLAIERSFPYFEERLRTHGASLKENELRDLRTKVIDGALSCVSKVVTPIISGGLSNDFVNSVTSDTDSYNADVQMIVYYLDPRVTEIHQLLPSNILVRLVDLLTSIVVDQLTRVIVAPYPQKITPAHIVGLSKNIEFFASMSMLVSVPQAKARISGLQKLFGLLTNPRVGSIVNDSRFSENYKGIPTDVLSSLVSRYVPEGPVKLPGLTQMVLTTIVQKISPNRRGPLG